MLSRRSYYIYAAVLIVAMIYVYRLFQLQVLDDKYAVLADKISLRKQTIYPQRGLIFDRNKKLLVYNEPVRDLMVSVPFQIEGIDTSLLCELIGIDTTEFRERLERAEKNAYQRKAVFLKNVSNKIYARIHERLFEFKGFFFEIRQDRNYKYVSSAHVLGFLGEVSRSDLESQESDYYEQGDFVGKKGVEQFYEEFLRGEKGEKYIYIDKLGTSKGSYQDGRLDIEPVDGNDLILTIDIALQEYGEQLLQNKMGSMVAIQPKTGEILALISSPFYNPRNFNIQNRSEFYGKAAVNPTKPLFNRAVSAPYPPGSTFKPLMALVALQDGAINPGTHFPCPGFYRLGGRIIRCHGHPSPTSLERSIASSCNTFYCHTFRTMMQLDKYEDTEAAYRSWYNYLQSFGLGRALGIDVNGESKGWLKDAEFYDRMHGKGSWIYANIISLSFGQGELGFTPMQMANIAATIANRGYFYTPHVIKSISGVDTIPSKYTEKHQTLVEEKYFNAVIEGMKLVTISGTAAHVAIEGIQIAGKTGTVQNPHGKNHSAYMAFAPADDPEIAIAVVVEESGYGATWAAPMAHLMIEKYMFPDSTTKKQYLEERLMNADLIPEKYKNGN
ncbi:penicillin-binding protein 2 [bacterium]|nr:penicillin-binding protein 2 [bacterium]